MDIFSNSSGKEVTIEPDEEVDLLDGNLLLPVGNYKYLTVILSNHLHIKTKQKYVYVDGSRAVMYGSGDTGGANSNTDLCYTKAAVTTYTGSTHDADDSYNSAHGVTVQSSANTSDGSRMECTSGDPGSDYDYATEIIDSLGGSGTLVPNLAYSSMLADTGVDVELAATMLKTDNVSVADDVDNALRIQDTPEFYSLGFKEFFSISSVSGSGTGELLDELVKQLPQENERVEDNLPRFAVVGRPNAGKSSFINALIGEDRYIVTDIAGTTRDSIDTKYNRFGFDFNLIDTAGIRRKAKVKEDIEFYSVMRSVRAIEYSDVCLLIVDGNRGFDGQVQNIFWLAHRNNKGIVILVNKWDLLEKDTNASKEYETRIRKEIAPFIDVPIVFISSLTKQRIFKAIEILSLIHI